MSNEFEDSLQDLIATEQLKSFSVIEEYCDICGDITPHHIDESKAPVDGHDYEEEPEFVKPISSLECVNCREEEEMKLEV